MNLIVTSWYGIITHNGTTVKGMTLLSDLVETESGVIELADGSIHDAYEGAEAPRKPLPFSIEFMLIRPTPEETETVFNHFKTYIGYNQTAIAKNEAGDTYTCKARLTRAALKPIFNKGQKTKNKIVKLDFVPFGEFLPT